VQLTSLCLSCPKRVQRYKLYFELPNFGETFCKVFLRLLMQVVFGATYFFMPSCPKRVQRYKLYFELPNFGETFCKVFLRLLMQVVLGATYFFMPSCPKRVQRYKLYFELPNFGETFCKVFLRLVMQAVLRCGEIVVWYCICPKTFLYYGSLFETHRIIGLHRWHRKHLPKNVFVYRRAMWRYGTASAQKRFYTIALSLKHIES
jgi:hypothetical protein